MRNRRIGLGLAGAAAALLVASSASATVMVEYSLEELVQGADTIVHATVIESDVRMNISDGSMAPETITTLRVHEWISGAGGETVTLRELGGVWNGGGLWYDGTPHYRAGEEVVLFLDRRAEAPYDLRTLGMVQGKFTVRQGLGGVPSTVVRDLEGVSFARWAEGRQTIESPSPEPAMQLDVFLDYVRQVRREYGGAR